MMTHIGEVSWMRYSIAVEIPLQKKKQSRTNEYNNMNQVQICLLKTFIVEKCYYIFHFNTQLSIYVYFIARQTNTASINQSYIILSIN